MSTYARRAAGVGAAAAGASLLGVKDRLVGPRAPADCKAEAGKKGEGEIVVPRDFKTKPIKCRDGTLVYPFSIPGRDAQLRKLKTEGFDVLVIGGGCVGAGVALDAQVRGLKTALVEADDFSAGTSGRSTKLIHGGIRYLETAFWKLDIGSYQLVQEALEERAHMLAAAPYMNSPLPIMIPIYKWWELPYFWAGAKAYDLVAATRQKSVPASHYIDADEAVFQFPMLRAEGLKGAIIYYDGQMNDTRMGLTVALTATQHGAVLANRVKVVKLLKDEKGELCGARVQDTLTNEQWDVRAKVVVNATGVFADSIRKMDDPEAVPLIEPAAGVHVMFPAHFSPANMGLIVPKTRDGRVLFFLPWEGCTLAGTTDSQSETTMTPQPTAHEVNFIMQETNRYLKQSVTSHDVIAAWSGLRPLVKDPEKIKEGTAALSRNHVIEVSEAGKLVTVTGGKWTTYRRMAEDTVDRVLKEKPALLADGFVSETSRTRDMKLLGADRARIVCDQKFNKIGITLRNDYELPEDVAKHLVKSYGTRALQVAELVRSGYADVKPNVMKRLSMRYPVLEAEVVFAVQQEYALKPMDVLARRTRLAFLDTEAARAALPRVVKLMGDLLGWSWRRRRQEEREALQFLDTMNVSKTSLLEHPHGIDVGEKQA